MKKYLCAVLAVIMIISSFSFSSAAVSYYGEEEAEFTKGYVYSGEGVINNVVYCLKNGKTYANKTKHQYYEIKSLFDSEKTAKNATAIKFVDEINGIPVETINMRGVEIPQENSKIKKIVLPSKLCSVNKNAFRGLSALETVVFPKNSKKFALGEKAFFALKSLKKVVVRGGAVSIGEEAFEKCTGLENVTFDVESVSFGDGAFSGCSALKGIKFPAKSSFGDSSFAGTGFESLSLPATASFNGESAFSKCKKLKTVKITAAVPVKKRVLLADEMFLGCKKLKTVSVSSNVKKLAVCKDAFKDCTALKSFAYSGGCDLIESGAFENCKSLASFTLIGNNVKVSNDAFKGCAALKKFVIGSRNPEMLKGKAGSFMKYLPKSCKVFVENEKMKTAVKKTGFKGQVELTEINVPTVKNLKVAGRTTSKIRLNWDKAKSVTGYVVYCYSPKDKKYVKLSATDSLTFVAANLKSKTTYKFIVKAYKRVNGNNYYGNASAVLTSKTR